jgi:hypothetical protein
MFASDLAAGESCRVALIPRAGEAGSLREPEKRGLKRDLAEVAFFPSAKPE